MTADLRVCVVGAGAIGSLFAAHLSRVDGVEVWAYDVSTAVVDAITANGLRIDGADGFTAAVNARTSAADIPACDFGIVATKSEHTRSAIAAVANVLRDAAVASVQNGVGNEELIAESVSSVIRGSTLVAGSIAGPGVVRLDAPRETWLGPFEPSPASASQIQQLADLLSLGGLPTQALADSRGAQWTKLIFNAANNSLCAATGLSIAISAPAYADTQVCDTFGSTTINGGKYIVQNNEWGDTSPQCINATDTGFSIPTASATVPAAARIEAKT